jgi:heme-degrading monooxygenase HmoA
MSVVFINLFEVTAGRDETFRDLWQQVNDYIRTQPGYQAHRLHRAARVTVHDHAQSARRVDITVANRAAVALGAAGT